MIKPVFVFLFLLSVSVFQAQKADSLKQDHYFRLNYDNDFFSATDRYYTQGILAELILPGIKKSPPFKSAYIP
jgi:lipid A 3-O-deacylase